MMVLFLVYQPTMPHGISITANSQVMLEDACVIAPAHTINSRTALLTSK
jgi:hypothetical protein